MDINLKYRKWLSGKPPQPIKLQIPGWAGEFGHENGDKPQPWHCPPFVEASTYGLEIIYPLEEECRVVRQDNEIKFEGNFFKLPNGNIPFSSFAPDHYGFTSFLDILPPEDYVVRIEPHPRFFTDTTGTCPIATAGHIQSWWSRIFFIAFKAPREGETHIFRQNEPFAQILIVPKKITYNIQEMSQEEASKRAARETTIANFGNKHIAKHRWKDHKGNSFDDKYKVLASAFAKDGEAGVDALLANVNTNVGTKMKIKRKLILRETNHSQDQK